jgi:hypothetical protein
MNECCICGERLSDPVSIARGAGPVCAAKLANFLVTVGSSAEEVALLALVDDSATARWLRLAARAIGVRRSEEATRFFNSAREAAKVARRVRAAEQMAA